jgi:hypothetical protein
VKARRISSDVLTEPIGPGLYVAEPFRRVA